MLRAVRIFCEAHFLLPLEAAYFPDKETGH